MKQIYICHILYTHFDVTFTPRCSCCLILLMMRLGHYPDSFCCVDIKEQFELFGRTDCSWQCVHTFTITPQRDVTRNGRQSQYINIGKPPTSPYHSALSNHHTFNALMIKRNYAMILLSPRTDTLCTFFMFNIILLCHLIRTFRVHCMRLIKITI